MSSPTQLTSKVRIKTRRILTLIAKGMAMNKILILQNMWTKIGGEYGDSDSRIKR